MKLTNKSVPVRITQSLVHTTSCSPPPYASSLLTQSSHFAYRTSSIITSSYPQMSTQLPKDLSSDKRRSRQKQALFVTLAGLQKQSPRPIEIPFHKTAGTSPSSKANFLLKLGNKSSHKNKKGSKSKSKSKSKNKSKDKMIKGFRHVYSQDKASLQKIKNSDLNQDIKKCENDIVKRNFPKLNQMQNKTIQKPVIQKPSQNQMQKSNEKNMSQPQLQTFRQLSSKKHSRNSCFNNVQLEFKDETRNYRNIFSNPESPAKEEVKYRYVDGQNQPLCPLKKDCFNRALKNQHSFNTNFCFEKSGSFVNIKKKVINYNSKDAFSININKNEQLSFLPAKKTQSSQTRQQSVKLHTISDCNTENIIKIDKETKNFTYDFSKLTKFSHKKKQQNNGPACQKKKSPQNLNQSEQIPTYMYKSQKTEPTCTCKQKVSQQKVSNSIRSNGRIHIRSLSYTITEPQPQLQAQDQIQGIQEEELRMSKNRFKKYLQPLIEKNKKRKIDKNDDIKQESLKKDSKNTNNDKVDNTSQRITQGKTDIQQIAKKGVICNKNKAQKRIKNVNQLQSTVVKIGSF